VELAKYELQNAQAQSQFHLPQQTPKVWIVNNEPASAKLSEKEQLQFCEGRAESDSKRQV